MNRTLIYIGESLLDIFSKSLLAITYQLVDIRDLKIRKVSYTSTLELPPTEHNLLTLGLPQNIHSNSVIPYSELTARCLCNGQEYFSGRFEITEVSRTIKTSIKNSSVEVFDLIKGKKLHELGYLPDGAWLAANIDSARLGYITATGIMAPVMNWGDFDTATPAINSTLYLPSYFYMELVKKILESTGFTFEGSILEDNDLEDLIIPFSADSFQYSQAFQEERTFRATFIGTQQISTSTTEDIDLDSADPVGLYFNVATSKYEIPTLSGSAEIGRLDLFLAITMDVNILAGTGMTIEVKIVNGAGTLVTSGVIVVSADSTVYRLISIEDTPANSGEEYWATITTVLDVGASAIVTISPVFFYGGFKRTANRNYLFHNYLLPDLTQDEILKDFLVRVGGYLKPETDGTTITVKTIGAIIRDKSVVRDWTTKRVLRDDRISFDYESYAQNNYFRYEEGDNVPDHIGVGNLPVNNENLETEVDYYTSPFENSLTLNPDDVSVNMAYIPVFDGTSVTIEDFVNQPGLKLLTLRDRSTAEPAITFNATPRLDYRVAYFVDVSQDKDTGFQYFVETYYPELIVSFDKTKLIDRDYILNVDDITDDVFIIFDSGNYFLVNKIPKFIAGKITDNVELLRVF